MFVDCGGHPDPPPTSAPLHDYTPPVVPAKAGSQGGVGTRGSVENTPVRTCTSSSGGGFGVHGKYEMGMNYLRKSWKQLLEFDSRV